ncbi:MULTISPECIES: DUF4189 domain-containing protein [unclassified Nocardia]|uniref:DUF4189 domain-containing protein n=1 Tax=unclassified Nocardia TaxID=2637762 RepID=UPI0024A8FECD|nr:MULTISPECIES: DUF4189 domain-containing protein [unclassified Nocardia]
MGFLSKAAMSLVVSAAALTSVGMGTAAAEPGPDGYWGAIAVGAFSDFTSYGSAWNYPDRASAEQAALAECGYRGCEVLASWANGCGAVAMSEDTMRFHGGTGVTRPEAERAALDKLAAVKPPLPFPFTGSSSPERGVIKESVCTD